MANVFGTDNSETLNAFDGVTNGADTIFGFGGNDTISGLGGNDEIKGGAGADAINGGSGTDTANYSDSTVGVVVSLISGQGFGGTAEGDTLTSIENLTGSAHEDFLIGNDGNNVLVGLEDDDILKGGGGADTLYGDSGSDTLKGGGGADTLNGGSGSDTASYAESSAGVFVSLYNDVAAYGDAEGDELNSIENLTGSAHDDDLWGHDGTNTLRGMGGNDSLKGYGGADSLWGGDGNDSLYGMAGTDTLRGEAGNDTLIGGASGDTLIGGTGSDTASYAGSSAGVYVDMASNTTAFGDAAGDSLSEIENLVGSGFADTLQGNDNDNVIQGGAGGDQIVGLGGSDTASYAGSSVGVYVDMASNTFAFGDAAGDTLVGIENLRGSGHADTLQGNDNDNVIEGGAGGDQIVGLGGSDTASYAGSSAGVYVDLASGTLAFGHAAGDTLSGIENVRGSGFADTLQGNDNDNIIEGGAGNDTLIGLGGSDTFVFNSAFGDDVIDDFGATAGPGHDAIQFAASEFASFADVQAWAIQVGSDVLIQKGGDADSLTLTNVVLGNLSADDFLFV